MSMATLLVQVAFTTNAMETPSWTDITAYVRSFSIERGRQYELGRMETGTAKLVLNNDDRRFDPEYGAGPYYGNIWPMRKLRISATWNSVTYYLFTGFIEEWLPKWVEKKDAIVEVSAADGFKLLAMAKVNATYSAEKVHTRLNNVLDDVDWSTGTVWVLDSTTNSQLDSTTILGPNGDRLIDESVWNVQGVTLTNTVALSHVQDVVNTELGLAFIDGEGSFVFHNRYRLMKPPYTTAQANFGDDGVALGYYDIILSYDDEEIYNDVRMTREGGTEQAVANAASKTKYGFRTLEESGLLMITDLQALDRANFLLDKYKDKVDQETGLPMIRVAGLVIRPQRADALWPQVLGRELGDRINVSRTSPISSDQDCRIEKISHEGSPAFWQTEWQLSTIDSRGYWLLDDAVYSVLGDTTRLVY